MPVQGIGSAILKKFSITSGGINIMRNNTWTSATLAFATLLQPIVAFAGVSDGSVVIPVSEPETLALLAIGAVSIIVARWAKRK
jgi:hypothetical protein